MDVHLSLLLEDCQNSRSLCRFYSRSLGSRYEREIQPLPGTTAAASSPELFQKVGHGPSLKPPATKRPPWLEGYKEPPLNTWCAEKDFYPTGGPRGLSHDASRVCSVSSSVHVCVYMRVGTQSHGTCQRCALQLRFPAT